MKKCNKCLELKDSSEFFKDKDKKDGLCTYCKPCKLISISNYYENNKQEIKEYQQGYYIENKDKFQEHNQQYYLENSEQIKRNSKNWSFNNRGIANALSAKYRAMKLEATPKWLTEEQLKEILEFYIIAQELQWLSEEPLEVDHIIPIRGKNVRGLHVPWNLQILPKSLNTKKSNKIL